MSARSMLRRFVGVAALTTVGLASTPFAGVAAAIGDPVTVVPAAGSTAGKRPVISATYAAAIEKDVSTIRVYSVKDGPTSSVAGTTTYSNGNKTMTLTLSADLSTANAPYEVRAVAVPAAGSNDPVVNTKTWQFGVDSIAPAAPTVTLAPARTNGLVTVSGTAEPNATVSVSVARTDAPNIKVPGSAVADAAGAYTVANVDVSSLTDGAIVATAVATDAALNSSAPASANGVKDTVAPVRATTFPADQRSAKTRNTVTVTFDEALRTTGSSLAVKNGLGSTLAGATAFSNGDLTMTFTAESPLTPGGGVYSIVANATDVAGNLGTTTTTFTIDDTAPAAPSVALTDPINLANRATAAVSGTAEPGARVDVSVDDAVAGSPVLGSGDAHPTSGAYAITVDLTALADGAVRAVATATDGAGNTGPSSTSAASAKDTVAPAAPTVDMTSPVAASRATTVSGTAEPGSTVLVSVDDADAATAPVTTEAAAHATTGAYTSSLTLTGLKDGVVTASVKARDAAGNASAAGTDTATLDTGLPAKPTLAMPVVNAANKAAVAATGAAEPGSTVTVTVSDGTNPVRSKDAVAAGDGAYSATFDTTGLADGTLTVAATAKDGAGNVSEPASIQVVRDTAAPAAPAVVAPAYVNDASKAAVELSGTAEAGSTVRLVVSDTSATTADVVETVVASPTGAWAKTADLSSLVDGALAVSVTAKDAAGNTSAAQQASSVKDVVAPAVASVALTDPISPANVATAAVSGSAPSAATVAVSVNDTDAATAPVTAAGPLTGDGTFDVPVNLSALSDGAVTATVTVRDAAGNTSAPRASAASAKDTTALARVATLPADLATVRPPAAVSATFNEALSTSQTTIKLLDKTGALLAGTRSFANGDRTVVFTPSGPLADAASPYVVQLAAKDADGSDSAPSTFSFTVDATPPAKPSLTLPSAVNAAGQAAVPVSGVAEPGSSVTVSVDDATAGSPVTKTVPAHATSGAYSTTLDLTALADGALAATAVATDVAGNASEPQAASSVKDTAAPAVPTVGLPEFVNAATKAAVTVSGVAEPGSSVALSVDDATAGSPVTATAAADATSGAYSAVVDLTALADGTVVARAIASDAAGNPSDAKTASATKDVVAPAAPAADLGDTTTAGGKALAGVAGTAEPGSTVGISIDDTTAGDAVTKTVAAHATSGAYSTTLDVTALADGPVTATVTATDAAGNTSPATTDTATKDMTAPAAPPTVSLPQYVNLANQAAVAVSGVAGPGNTVMVSLDDEVAETAAIVATAPADAETGEYRMTLDASSLQDALLIARAVAKDGPGNPSSPTTATTTKDTWAPMAPSVTVATVNAANKSGVTVKGLSEYNGTVVVSIDDATAGDALTASMTGAGANGAYETAFDLTSFADGTVTATVRVTDQAGNVSPAGTGTAQKDTVAPAAPTVTMSEVGNAANSSSVTVSGAAEPGSLVRVSVDDTTPGSAVVSEVAAHAVTGEYAATMEVTSLADGVLTATVTTADAVGNTSPAGTATATKDASLPDVPVLAAPAEVTRATRAAAPFAGTAEPGHAIAITVDDADEATGVVAGATVAAADGAWAIELDLRSLRDGVLSVAVTASESPTSHSAARTGSVTKNSTRAFTITRDMKAPASGESPTFRVRAHSTYQTDSPIDTSFTGTPVLTSTDTHFTAGSCPAAVAGESTCTGSVVGDLGRQTLTATSGSGEDLLTGTSTVHVAPATLAFVDPPATAEPNQPVTFTVVPTVGVEGASIAGYEMTRVLSTRGGLTTPADGAHLACRQVTCQFTVTFHSRGIKEVAVSDLSRRDRTTGFTTVVVPYVTTLSLARSATTVPSGGYVTLSGKLLNTQTLTGVGGRPVTIYRKIAPATAYTAYTTVATAADGTWVKRLAQSRNTSYYAKFTGDALYLGTESLARSVKASQVVTASWLSSGRTVRVSGKVSPNAAGRSVYLQYRRTDGSWAYAGAVTTASGTSSYTLRKTFTGPRVLRVSVSATAVNAAGYSRSFSLR